MKDFYDVWVLSRAYEFNDDRLERAVAATFRRRDTALPAEAPEALTATFANDLTKQRQWQAFVRDLGVEVPGLGDVVSDLAAFLLPHARRAAALHLCGPSATGAP